jgi:pimeloyl-ACP methyl ester carboxylesterase
LQAASQQPVTATIMPTAPAVSSDQSGAGAAKIPQLGRQVIGLISDVGTVAASAVYTVANTVAQAFGPHSFLGVPYALATAVANTAAAAGRTLIGAPLDSAGTGPFPVNYGIIDGLTFFNPKQPPTGANDPSITVTAEHPLPIILINGTIATQGENWGVGAPDLANAGYKVYTFNYGNITQDPNFPIQATDDIRKSGLELAAEVDRVLAETGAPKVILIGHSQGGGILPVYYINNLDGADTVSQLIGIAPSNHGTDLDGLIGLQHLPILGPLIIAAANLLGQAFEQQALGSPFQEEVYGDGDTRPGVLYTTIASMNDEVVTPYTQQALNGPNVTNIVVQDLYPGLPAGHLGVVLSPQVWSVVLNALASNPQANPLAHPLQSEELAA